MKVPRSTPSSGAGTPMYSGRERDRVSVAQWREVFGGESDGE